MYGSILIENTELIFDDYMPGPYICYGIVWQGREDCRGAGEWEAEEWT